VFGDIILAIVGTILDDNYVRNVGSTRTFWDYTVFDWRTEDCNFFGTNGRVNLLLCGKFKSGDILNLTGENLRNDAGHFMDGENFREFGQLSLLYPIQY
jgi:hypothetical protein